jgi:hypothetical protein
MSKTKLGLVIASVVVAGQVSAAFTFPLFTTSPSNTAAPGIEPTFTALSGAPAGVYNSYSVTVQWGGSVNDAWSNEAIFALTDEAALTATTVFYADPGASTVSAGNSSPRTLTWSGLLDEVYTGGDPLFFAAAQTFAPSSATWSNVSVTLDSIVIPPTLTTTFSGDTTGGPTWDRPFSDFSGLSALGVDVLYEVIPFFVPATGVYTIAEEQEFDGFLYIYEDVFDSTLPLVNGVIGNDDGPGGIGTSLVSTTLTAGTQYYIVTTGFEDIEFGLYDGTISSTAGLATIGLIPEPSSLSLVAAAGLLAARRRRAA